MGAAGVHHCEQGASTLYVSKMAGFGPETISTGPQSKLQLSAFEYKTKDLT